VRVRLSTAAAADLAAILDVTLDRRGEDQARAYLTGLGERLESIVAPAEAGLGAEFIRLRYRSHDLFLAPEAGGVLVVRILPTHMGHPRHQP
jgi:plasmid stabilization system protein ParE